LTTPQTWAAFNQGERRFTGEFAVQLAQ